MGIAELEEAAGITEKDYQDCPYGDCNETCKLNLFYEDCEELYEKYLLEKIVEKEGAP